VERPTVLVVDDETDVLLLCRVNLEFEGYQVTEASNGEDALRIAREDPPEVILLDVMMPKMDGWQVLRELKSDARTAGIPIVMLTAKTQDSDQIKGWTEGAAEYITKPFSPLALSQVVRGVMAARGNPGEEERRRQQMVDKLRLLSAADPPQAGEPA